LRAVANGVVILAPAEWLAARIAPELDARPAMGGPIRMEWTLDARLRHASFAELRLGKNTKFVVRE